MMRDICSTANFDDQSVNTDCSVRSEYSISVVSQPLSNLMADSLLTVMSSLPTMTVLYSHDACLIEPRGVEYHTRSLGKPAFTLKQALAHQREMRRHHLDHLVDEYLCAWLRMNVIVMPRPLSFSRLKIAAESLPILLGGDPRMWQRWIFMISRIPGGLYVIREKIPVRGEQHCIAIHMHYATIASMICSRLILNFLFTLQTLNFRPSSSKWRQKKC